MADETSQNNIETQPRTGAMQEDLLTRGMAEVYLLFDNVSSTRAKMLPSLLNGDAMFPGPNNWIEQIFEIGWPVDATAQRNRAHMAAQLIVAKDALNAAAAPATAASIAFTTLVSEVPVWSHTWSRIWPFGKKSESRQIKEDDAPVWPPSRGAIAATAFPGFNRSARFFALSRELLVWGLILWLCLTCVLSWDVATGSALLNRTVELQQKIVDAAGTGKNECLLFQDYTVARINLRHWVGQNPMPRWLLAHWVGGGLESTAMVLPRPAGCANAGDQAAVMTTNVEWATVFISVLAGTILPIFYGVLGAGAAVVRGFSTKIRDYLLTPRDLRLAGIQLALGAVIGACIGLFVNSDGNGEGGLVGSVHLSQSALCFVAGYGVEGVFQALDELVRRVFNLDHDRPVPPPQTLSTQTLPPVMPRDGGGEAKRGDTKPGGDAPRGGEAREKDGRDEPSVQGTNGDAGAEGDAKDDQPKD